MKDTDALDFLAEKMGGPAGAAAALGISAQRLDNWKRRGISASMRPAVWAMVNDHGGHLSREWLMPKPPEVPAQPSEAA